MCVCVCVCFRNMKSKMKTYQRFENEQQKYFLLPIQRSLCWVHRHRDDTFDKKKKKKQKKRITKNHEQNGVGCQPLDRSPFTKVGYLKSSLNEPSGLVDAGKQTHTHTNAKFKSYQSVHNYPLLLFLPPHYLTSSVCVLLSTHMRTTAYTMYVPSFCARAQVNAQVSIMVFESLQEIEISFDVSFSIEFCGIWIDP